MSFTLLPIELHSSLFIELHSFLYTELHSFLLALVATPHLYFIELNIFINLAIVRVYSRTL